MLGSLGLSLGFSGGSAGPAVSGGGALVNSADIVFSGGSDAGVSAGTASAGTSTWIGLALVAAAIAAGWIYARA